MMINEERLMIFEVAEAGALIQRHMGNGAVYEAIETAEDFLVAHTEDVDDAELPDPEDTAAWESITRAAFIVGFGEGASRKAFQDNEPPTVNLGRYLDTVRSMTEDPDLLRAVDEAERQAVA